MIFTIGRLVLLGLLTCIIESLTNLADFTIFLRDVSCFRRMRQTQVMNKAGYASLTKCIEAESTYQSGLHIPEIFPVLQDVTSKGVSLVSNIEEYRSSLAKPCSS